MRSAYARINVSVMEKSLAVDHRGRGLKDLKWPIANRYPEQTISSNRKRFLH